jgi:tRNA(fMet)-specific endonuclease VapC
MKLREPIASRVRAAGPAEFAVSTITCAALWYGAVNSQRPQRNRADQNAFLEPFRIVEFDVPAADRYAVVRGHLTRMGRPIGDRDLMIAAIALAHRMGVITRNTGELSRVPNLKVEDWTAG